MSYIDTLQQHLNSPERLCLGLMSGTSADAIDASLISISEKTISLIDSASQPLEPSLRESIHHGGLLTAREVSLLNQTLGERFADVAEELCTRHKILPVVIGSHGQTIYHYQSSDPFRSTFQIGAAECIAERINTFIVSDFRGRDIAAGGQGAPLTPYTDLRLYGGDTKVVVNIGGISNLTVIQDGVVLCGYDSGPGNAPLDRLTRLLTEGRQSFDVDGALAASVSIDDDLFALLKQDEYFSQPFPKSTGIERYGDSYVKKLLAEYGGVSNSLLATVTEIVAFSIGESIHKHALPSSAPVVLAGGGSKNSFLRSRIQHFIGERPLRTSEDLGIPSQLRESMAFAVLAHDVLFGGLTSLPQVTGAKEAVPLGKILLPKVT